MSKFCKYYKQKKQVSYDNGVTWEDVTPLETQIGSLYEANSSDCGYLYVEKWENLDPNVDYYCKDTCDCQEPIYQWNPDKTDYEEFGPYSCYTEYYQVSLDGGVTWENVYPIQTRKYENCVGCQCRDESHDTSSCCWYIYVVLKTGLLVPIDRNCSDKDIGEQDLSRAGALSAMVSITISNGCCEEILSGAFTGCTSLKIVSFPCSITKLGSNLFKSSDMDSIIIKAVTPPTIQSNTFNNSNNCPIYVYEQVVEKYKTAWPSLADRIKALEEK